MTSSKSFSGQASELPADLQATLDLSVTKSSITTAHPTTTVDEEEGSEDQVEVKGREGDFFDQAEFSDDRVEDDGWEPGSIHSGDEGVSGGLRPLSTPNSDSKSEPGSDSTSDAGSLRLSDPTRPSLGSRWRPSHSPEMMTSLHQILTPFQHPTAPIASPEESPQAFLGGGDFDVSTFSLSRIYLRDWRLGSRR